MAVGIICPCLITLRPIIRKILRQPLHTSGHDQSTRPVGTDNAGIFAQQPPGAFHRLGHSLDHDRVDSTELAYHTVISREPRQPRPDEVSLAGIRVIKDINVEHKENV